ncbi:MAG: hypothetical protein MUO19_02650, partial [Dehalococcoidales bacterium]|nr:hypothetical protein [Dehalococcoidales bacterium]
GRVLMEESYTRVDPEKLGEFSSLALRKMGVPEEDADITAKILVAADLRGVDMIRLAGDAEHEKERDRRASGIPLHSSVIASLRKLAGELDIPYTL